MRKFISGFLSLVLSTALVATVIPQNLYAAETTPQAAAKYVYDSATNKRTGIESIKIDNVTYYDMEQGRGSLSPESGNEMEFYKKVLTGNAADDEKNSKYSGNSNMLDQWAEVAEQVFQDNAYYSADINASGNFEENFGKRWGDAGYTDISKALSSLTRYTKGEEGWDYTIVSGLSYTDSLSKVRQKASDQIVDMIGTNALTSEYEDNKNYLFENTDGDNTMKSLKNDTKQDVMYTMVTCVDDEGATYAYHYNSFVMAFYDFKLVPLAAEGLKYITNAEGYDSIEEASKAHVEGVSYESNNTSNVVDSYFKNSSKVSNNINLSLNESHSESLSNSFSNSKSYSYSETIGYEMKFHHAVPIIGDAEHTIKASFTAGQVFSSSTSESKSVTDSSSMNVSSSITLPAHTAAAITSSGGNTSASFGYKCPVAVTFKVALATLSGELYADRAWTLHIGTAGYPHKTFSTTFGSDSSKGGLTARENLYKRSVENVKTAGFEETYGNTYGYRYVFGGDHKTMSALNWNSILGGDDIVIDPKTATYSVIYREVDADGKLTGKTLNNSDGKQKLGYDSYEITETAPDTYTSTFIETDKDGNEQEIKKDYVLYRGKVTSESGDSITNTFLKKDTNEKTLILSGQDNRLYYYYQEVVDEKKDDGIKTDTTESVKNSSTSANAVDTPTNSTITKETLREIIGWLSKSNPMSQSGGSLTWDVKSKSTSVGNIVPLYPLSSVSIPNLSEFGDYVISSKDGNQYFGQYYDANALLDLTIYPGDKFLTKNVSLAGWDKDGVAYYGFHQKYGHWEAVKKDENGKWIPDSSTNVAQLVKDEITGNQYVEAGNTEGIYYIQYFINEDQYTSLDNPSYAKNNDVTRPIVRLNIKKAPFKGNISLSGSYTGTVDTESVDLDNLLNVFVTDEKGNKIEKEVLWEAKDKKGITVTTDGQTSFSDAGSYDVRVGAEGVYSDWLTITAKELPKLAEIRFTAPNFKKSEVTLTDTKKTLDYDLESYLSYYDQYGNVWTGDVPEVSFSLDYAPGGNISNDTLTVSKEDTYNIYASAEGFTIDPIAIKVTDDRKVGSIKVSGTYVTVIGDSASNLNDVLNVSMEDTTGKDVEKPYTWDVQELKGIKVQADGTVEASKSGSYHVRAVNEAGQYSDWHAITVKDPSISIDKTALEITQGETATITATVSPAEAQKKDVKWTSNDESIATVTANGQITAIAPGSAVITAENAYGQKVTCTVTVQAPKPVPAPYSIATGKKSGKSIVVSWTKVAEATGYEVYGNFCTGKVKLLSKVPANKFSVKIKKIDKKALTKSCYKFYVKSYKMADGKKVYLTETPSIHVTYKKSKKIDNASKITLSSNSVLKVGGTVNLKASVKLPKGKKQISHVAAIRYLSSDPAVATVDATTGKVTAVSAGSCYVYALAVNGMNAKVTITVQ